MGFNITQNPAKAKKTRKVIVVEGLYLNYGDLAPLPKLVELKKKYSTPLIIDESFSFGVLGGTGRGALEHFGLSVSVYVLLFVYVRVCACIRVCMCLCVSAMSVISSCCC